MNIVNIEYISAMRNLLWFCLLFLPAMLLAQRSAIGTVNVHSGLAAKRLAQLTIPMDRPLHPQYELDWQVLAFANEAEAQWFANYYRDNYVSFELDYDAGVMRMVLHPARVPAAWTSADWNAHLAQKQPASFAPRQATPLDNGDAHQ